MLLVTGPSMFTRSVLHLRGGVKKVPSHELSVPLVGSLGRQKSDCASLSHALQGHIHQPGDSWLLAIVCSKCHANSRCG